MFFIKVILLIFLFVYLLRFISPYILKYLLNRLIKKKYNDSNKILFKKNTRKSNYKSNKSDHEYIDYEEIE